MVLVVEDDDEERDGMGGHCLSMNSNFCPKDVVSPDLTKLSKERKWKSLEFVDNIEP